MEQSLAMAANINKLTLKTDVVIAKKKKHFVVKHYFIVSILVILTLSVVNESEIEI